MYIYVYVCVRLSFLAPCACICFVQCVFAQRQRLCKYRHGLCLQVLYVPDPEYVSSVGSSPSLSPISPLSPTSSEADLEKVTVCWPRLWCTVSHIQNMPKRINLYHCSGIIVTNKNGMFYIMIVILASISYHLLMLLVLRSFCSNLIPDTVCHC